VRHCAMCKLNVYNLSDMTRAEAEKLLSDHEGAKLPCVNYYQRKDGTIITKDCPVGLEAVRRRMAWLVNGMVAAMFFCAGNILWAAGADGSRTNTAASRIKNWLMTKGVYGNVNKIGGGPERCVSKGLSDGGFDANGTLK